MREIATEEKWDRLRNLNRKRDGVGGGGEGGLGVEGGWVKRCLGLDKLYSGVSKTKT